MQAAIFTAPVLFINLNLIHEAHTIQYYNNHTLQLVFFHELRLIKYFKNSFNF